MADTELYDVLEVGRHATETEITKAYRRLVRQHHPDKGGDEEKFKNIQTAYEVLSDPQKRDMYDRYGMDGVKEDGPGPGPSMFSESLFSHLFGGDHFGFGGGRRRRAKAETIGIPLEVTLEELYTGTTKSVEYKRKVLCKTCSGTGGKHGSVVRCRKCSGQGIQITHRPIGPGMVQQIQSMCTDCGGTGDFIREKDRCKKCKGKRVMEVDEKIEVPIAPGMRHEQKIPFRGKADEIPDGDAGDMIVILQEEDHPLFRRVDIDLLMKKKISLKEALCGCEFTIKHLDGQQLLVKTKPGEVVAPGSIKGVRELGMSQFRHTDIKGNLYIKFEIVFPDSGFLPEEEDRKVLASLLPPPPPVEPAVDAEEVDMIEFEGTKGDEGDHRREAYNDSDDEDGPRVHSHGMGCTQQ